MGKNARASRRINLVNDAKKSQEEGMIDDERNKAAEVQKAITKEKVAKGIPITDP